MKLILTFKTPSPTPFLALPLAPGKVPLKTALQCILDSTAVYLDFHCSENGNGWLGARKAFGEMRAFLVVFLGVGDVLFEFLF